MDVVGIGIVLIFLSVVLSLLPTSPFAAAIEAIDSSSPIFAYLGWILPIDEVIVTMELWLVAVSTYYTVKIIGRWIKLLDGG